LQTGISADSVASMLMGMGQLIWDPSSNSYQMSTTPAADRDRAMKDFFQTSPDYQFRMKEGVNALDRSAASKGMLLSGAQTKATQQYGGDLASGEYNNYFNKLLNMSNTGQNANATASGQGAALVGEGIKEQFQGDMARASSYSNSANALASGISKGVDNIFSGFGAMGGFRGLGGGGGSTVFSDGSTLSRY
jgi:hypothetical protein